MSCDTAGGLLIYLYIKKAMTIIMIIAPMILLVLGTIDFMGAVTAGDEKGMRKSIQTFLKRILICVVILLLPYIIGFIMSFATSITKVESKLLNCIEEATDERVAELEAKEENERKSILEKLKEERKKREEEQKKLEEERKKQEEQLINIKSGFTSDIYDGMRYYLNVPENPTKNMPLVIFLHGKGNCNNFSAVANFKLTNYVKAYSKEKFIFLAPKTPYCDWQDGGVIKILTNLIDSIGDTYEIDKSRIYLTGHSLGGSGVWAAAERNPNKYAALVVLSGFGSINPSKVLNTPVRTYAGTDDDPDFIIDNRYKCKKINDAGGNCEYISVVSNHVEVANVAYNDELFDWMLNQKLGG